MKSDTVWLPGPPHACVGLFVSALHRARTPAPGKDTAHTPARRFPSHASRLAYRPSYSEPMSSAHRIDPFLRDAARALHVSGSPAPDLERHIGDLGEKLGVRARGFALPTMLSIAVDEPDGRQRVQLLRLPPSDYNMGRLIALEALVAEFSGPDSLDDAARRVREIMDAPPPWRGPAMVVFGFILSASVAPLFGGGAVEMLCGGLVGTALVIGFLLLSRWPRLGPVLPVLLCAGAALLAHALCLAFPHQTVFITVLSGIVLLLPGFITTIALSELATQNLLAGSGRLAGAFILMVMMGAGVALGTKLGTTLIPAQPLGTAALVPAWAFWSGIALFGVSLLGVLQAPLRSAPVIIGACLFACALMLTTNASMGPIAGAFCSAFLVSLVGHLYRRVTGKPAMLFQVPGLLTLVPGSVGFRGLSALIDQNFLEGIRITTGMLLTGTALAVGMLLANGIAPILLHPDKEKMTGGRSPGIM